MPVDVLSTLFPAVAEAVLSYALDKLDPADRVRSWLKLDPARLAYQKALARAYTAFARQYPELTASLFDESFLKREAAPELAKQLTRHQSPDPAHLTALWVESFWSKLIPETPERQEQKQSLIKRHIQPASEFLRWLEAELKAELAFGPLFDSRALESLPAIEARLGELTAELQRGFQAALSAARQYHSVITVDKNYGNIISGQGNTITAVYNYYFANDFATLNDYYIPPDSVFQRVRVQDFVGREWLTAKVDAFLDDPARKSGAFVLVGEAGVGKTSFAAHLVSERRYLHLFAEQVPGEANLPRALQSLGAQLVSRYQIEPYKGRDTLTQLSTFPDFLDRLLRLAANTLAAGEKIVIVCDALDEAGTAPGGNVFGLPSVLPDGVYLLLTQRPVPTRLNFKFAPHNEKLDAASADNLHDVEAYLTAIARRPEIAGQLRARNYSEAAFVQTLAGKSGGVWMYLYYVVQEIQTGSRAPLDLAKLPPGLAGYYGEYWGDWGEGRNGRGEGAAKWNALYAPLLATLAAAQEPVSVEQLTTWLGTSADNFEVGRLLKQNWRAFVTEREGAYTLYHASLRDFIIGDVARENLSVSSGYLVDELCDRAREAHKCIVEYYRGRCNGDWPKLIDDDYARRHLAAHLAGAGRHEELFALVALSNAWAEARYAKEESYAGYLIDLERAWEWTEAERGWDMSKQMRCAFIKTSIYSLAGNISPDLLFQVVEAGLWGHARALAYIQQMPDESQRAEALARIAALLPEALKSEALAVAREIRDKGAQAEALSGMAAHLPDELKAEALVEALAAVREIRDEWARAHALSRLATHLPEALKAEALAVVREIKDEWPRAEALSGLAAHLPEALKAEVLEAARGLQSERWRADALSRLVAHLSEPPRMKVLAEALAAAQGIEGKVERATVLSRLVRHLPDTLKMEVSDEALGAAREIEIGEVRAFVLRDLAGYLPESLKLDVLAETLVAVREMEDEWERADALSRLVGYLSEPLKTEVLAEVLMAARRKGPVQKRVDVLSRLAGYLSEPLKTEVLAEALTAAQRIEDEWAQANALAGLARYLPDTLKVEALAVARGIEGEGERVGALLGVAKYLTDTLKVEALAVARGIRNEWNRTEALSGLAEHLPAETKTEVLAEALMAAQRIEVVWARAAALGGLVGHLSEPLKTEVLAEALTVAREIRDEREWAIAWDTLGRLVGDLSEPTRADILVEVLAAARGIEDEWERAHVLSGLAGYLPESLKSEALAIAWGISDEKKRAEVLGRLAGYLLDELKSEALTIVREIGDEGARADVLRGLAGHLPDSLKSEALTLVREIEDDMDRAYALSGLAAHLPNELKAEALAVVLKIRDEWARAEGLSGLAAHLPDELKAEALAAAREIRDEKSRAVALSGLAAHMPETLISEALPEALAATLASKSSVPRQRPELLSQIISTWEQVGYVDFGELRQRWPGLLRAVARHPRHELLLDLGALISLINHFGGEAAIGGTFIAVRDVVKWWP